MMISFPQKQERSTANTEPLSASQEKPQMTLLCYEEKERETSPILVTWATSRCVSNDAARTRNATWPLNLQKRAFLSIVLVKNRAKPPPPLTTYLVHECVLWQGIWKTTRKVTKCYINKFSTYFTHFSETLRFPSELNVYELHIDIIFGLFAFKILQGKIMTMNGTTKSLLQVI